MNKTFKYLGFKAGDKVKCIESNFKVYEVGKVYLLKDWNSEYEHTIVIEGSWNGYGGSWEKVEDMDFEDQWHLNDGKVTIPDDADKLEKDGSVVAFRKRKQPEFKFGDVLRIKKSLWLKDIRFPKMFDGLDYVRAVYIDDNYQFDGKNGIRAWVEGGFLDSTVYIIDLTKVSLDKETL